MSIPQEPSQVFDDFNIDLLVKVLSHTAFSELPRHKLFTFQDVTSQGPFFTFFIPLFYLSQGEQITSKSVIYSASHCAAVSAFCESIASNVAPFVSVAHRAGTLF